jgi:hypothetical protein
MRGRLDMAEELLREALSMETAHMDQEGLVYVTRSRSLVNVLVERGALDEAEARLREARDWWLRNFGAAHPFTLNVELDLAVALTMQEAYGEAEAVLLEGARPLRRASRGYHPPSMLHRNRASPTKSDQEKRSR